MGCSNSKSGTIATGSNLPTRTVGNTRLAASAQVPRLTPGSIVIKLDIEGRIEPLAQIILIWAGLDKTLTRTADVFLSEIQHCLDILKAWFGSIDDAKASLQGRRVIDLGSGKAFMTTVLAYMVSTSTSTPECTPGKVISVDDPATASIPTSAIMHEWLTQSENVSKHVQWKTVPPVDFLADGSVAADYVCIVHPKFDFGNEPDVASFMAKFRFWCSGTQVPEADVSRVYPSGTGAKLLFARWSLEYSDPAAQAHVMAIRAQHIAKSLASRRRLVGPLEELNKSMQAVGWKQEKHEMIIRPELSAAISDVEMTRSLILIPGQEIGPFGESMESLMKEHGAVKCMDVWTAVYTNNVFTITMG